MLIFRWGLLLSLVFKISYWKIKLNNEFQPYSTINPHQIFTKGKTMGATFNVHIINYPPLFPCLPFQKCAISHRCKKKRITNIHEIIDVVIFPLKHFPCLFFTFFIPHRAHSPFWENSCPLLIKVREETMMPPKLACGGQYLNLNNISVFL